MTPDQIILPILSGTLEDDESLILFFFLKVNVQPNGTFYKHKANP